eukprot:TRINITY_DN17829_c0_g1_i1.p2 TRINITY_DN17829_c0_g1~~TRINITY_DN17829_c0_g1_i1.p2  ORF type:complete len:107 (-),score=47.74 TRINITY_DN17829_c0_g1_i1:200-520(-)
MRGQILSMSQHKFASNVVEKCVQYGVPTSGRRVLEEITSCRGPDGSTLLTMMKDQYANYVVQKILDVVDDDQRRMLLLKIKQFIPQLKKFTYGKHIIARLEKANMI